MNLQDKSFVRDETKLIISVAVIYGLTVGCITG